MKSIFLGKEKGIKNGYVRIDEINWTYEIVNDFIYQENGVDCGVFVFFF